MIEKQGGRSFCFIDFTQSLAFMVRVRRPWRPIEVQQGDYLKEDDIVRLRG
jgi:hypothetical protein